MAIHTHILHNGAIRPSSDAAFRAGQLGLMAGWGVFTTLRVANGCLFAWERHWARMSRDARAFKVAMPASADETEAALLRLIEANGRPDCTMRLVVTRNAGGLWEDSASGVASDVIAMTADSKAWGESARLTIQPNGRFAACEFAGSKINSWGQNLTWAERAHEAGFDETILLNERRAVAECTSANIFAVRNDTVSTPPQSDGCLGGITREVLLNEIRMDGVSVVERSLTLDDLYTSDEVFITSTTRDLMPVSEIAGRRLDRAGDVRARLTAAFREFVARDIAGRVPVHV